MVRYLRTAVLLAVAAAYDLWQWVCGFWQVRVRHLDRRISAEVVGSASPPRKPGRIAVVAVFPSNASLPFTLNLLAALIMEDFFILVVSDRPLQGACRAALTQRCHCLIERAGVGADFGSYKAGLAWLDRHPDRMAGTDTLILANDSVFYPKCFSEELARMLSRTAVWQALFQSFEMAYHAQSSFLLFRRPIFDSPSFRRFWRRYLAYSSRRHRVLRGEIGLSTSLLRGGFELQAAYTASRFVETLMNSGSSAADLAELSPIIKEVSVRDEIFAEAVETAGTAAHLARRSPSADRGSGLGVIDRHRWIDWFAKEMEAGNPAHSAGLILNAMVHAPLKRDVCYRGGFNVFQVLRSARGFDEAELESMREDLSQRGISVSTRGVRRILRQTGRI